MQGSNTLRLRSSSRSSSRFRQSDDAPARFYYQLLGGPVEPVFEDITNPDELIKYIIKTGISQLVTNQLKVPFVMLFQDNIIDINHGKFNPELTTKENPIKICWKYIKNGSMSLYSFFTHRGITPDIEFLSRRRFRFAIEQLKDKAFSPSEADVMFIQKSTVARRMRKNEGPIGPLVGAVLTACLTKTDLKTIFIEEQYTFSDKEQHEAIVDHVIFKTNTLRPILICEDKFSKMNEGILQNFDQMRTFAASEHGRNFDMIYGITSNFNEWVFSCYLCPEDGKDVTANNFFISNTYKMNYDQHGEEPEPNSIKDILQKIRGLFQANIDEIVIESLNKEDAMIIEEKAIEETIMPTNNEGEISKNNEKDIS
jgi:hypothetical protein